MRFWLLLLVLWPLLLWQARRTRRGTPRLPEAAGPQYDQCGEGPALRLLVIGESPVAGVGVEKQAHGLGPAIAAPLAQRIGGRVHWHCHGTNGLRLAGLLEQPLPARVPDDHAPDIILIMMGVNDTTALTSLKRWRTELRQLIYTLAPHATLCFSPVPPMRHFTALPQPLRYVIGTRAAQLDACLREICTETGTPYLSYGPLQHPSLLARDGYHPSAAGYRAMGDALARQMLEKIPALRHPRP